MSSNTFSAPGISSPEQTPPWDISTLELSHPKNYLGVPLAIAADGPTGHLIADSLVEMVGAAKLGARTLGYLTTTDNLTSAGQELVNHGVASHGSPRAALSDLGNTSGRSRLVDEQSDWAPIIIRTLAQRSPLVSVVSLIDHYGPASLDSLVREAAIHSPEVVGTTFLRGTSDCWTPDAIHDRPLDKTGSYSSYAISQFKSTLYHSGILTERGADTSRHCPETDIWQLDTRGERLLNTAPTRPTGVDHV